MSTIRVANCSGFFGDRLSAAREMVDDGPIDVLTGDWLAELTMGVLAKQRARDPEAGYAPTFLVQLEQVLGTCLERGIRIVSNAGGLNPAGCARAVEQITERLGLESRVACVTGDDATGLLRQRRGEGWPAPHLDTGAPLEAEPLVANAYLGCWGIVEALDAGADVVITGRVSDASVVVGPAAWRFGWARDDWDALAGAVAAGHVIECGAQATGGNFSFFQEVPGLERCGFPIAELAADGSAVITKHPGTGGAVTVETVTAQLLYEIDGPLYASPDVVARFDTLTLEQEAADRVRISATRGEPAPEQVKVGAIFSGGWRNAVTFGLTGLDLPAKAALAEETVWSAIEGGRAAFDDVDVRLIRGDRPDPGTVHEASALLDLAVATADRALADRFSRAAVETVLAGYPGLYLTAPPGRATEIAVFWPTLLPAADFPQEVTLEGRSWTVAPQPSGRRAEEGLSVSETQAPTSTSAPTDEGATVRVPLGAVIGARSGDKGGNATLGVWARTDEGFAWLERYLTAERIKELVPEAAACEIRPWALPNLRSLGFTLVRFLGRGVAANLKLDAQAKGLGEYLRAKHVDAPAALVAAPTRKVNP